MLYLPMFFEYCDDDYFFLFRTLVPISSFKCSFFSLAL